MLNDDDVNHQQPVDAIAPDQQSIPEEEGNRQQQIVVNQQAVRTPERQGRQLRYRKQLSPDERYDMPIAYIADAEN